MSNFNPFFHGNPVPPNQLIGREKELRRIMGRIVNQGQSTAITGLPRSGKTSILEYLKAPAAPDFYGDWANQLIFSYVDAFALGGQCAPVQFWTQALKPLEEYLEEYIVTHSPAPALAEAYKTCQQNNFSTSSLERLIAQVRQAGLRLVLMIDGFDILLHYANLNNPEFFGSLRSIASRSKGGLALVITGNASLSQLHEATKQFNSTGSPYFNFMDEITLGPLSEADIDTLLHQGDAYFTEDDRRFIKKLAGGHPYPLQLASSILWEEYEHGDDKEPLERQQRVEQAFHNKVATTTANKKVGGEKNPLLEENLFTPRFLLVTFMGTVVGERIGHVLTSNLPMFAGGDFSVFIFKLVCAALGAFGGYKLFAEVTTRKNEQESPNKKDTMTDNMTDNEHKQELERREWDILLFEVKQSVCYHERRQLFFQHLRTLANLMILVFGATTIVALLNYVSGTLGLLLGALVTLIATIELIFDSCRMIKKHDELRKRFISLEQEMTEVTKVKVDEVDRKVYVEFHNKRLTLKKDEPPVLRVLSARCHNELVKKGMGNLLQEREFEIKWYQSLFANFIDIGEDKLRRRN